VLILLKRLVLAEYEIKFRGAWIAIVGALIVAKVVLVLEHVPLGRWTRRHPPALDVALRTLFYALGVFVAMLIERALDVRHEAGGFVAGIGWMFQHREIHHVLAMTIGVAVALLMFNAQTVLQRHLGEGGLSRLFFATPLAEVEAGRVKTDSSPS